MGVTKISVRPNPDWSALYTALPTHFASQRYDVRFIAPEKERELKKLPERLGGRK